MRLTISALVAIVGAGSVEADRRDGANHRIGDDSFVAAFGREPAAGDRERVRMATHLAHVRALLAARPATRPELQARRAEMIGYLDEYIAKGTTPENTKLPIRSPVFIDERGNICAVGYLIERSVGRDVAERVAARHRFDYLEDIAAAMSEVRAWIDASGFTLDELASIQPGYERPQIEEWRRWPQLANGTYRDTQENGVTTGRVVRGKLDGVWKRTDEEGVRLGEGKMRRGAGRWTSFYPSGKKLAVGAYDANHPHGTWTFFHESGNVAAVGAFRRGYRHGAWKFFHDDKAATLIARGAFHRGSIAGEWKHFDRRGELLATSTCADTPHPTWETGYHLKVVPGPDGVRHEMHRLGGPDHRRLDGYYLGDEKIFVDRDGGTLDADGFQLAKTDEGWTARDCGWSAKRRRIARNEDIVTLHGLLRPWEPTCGVVEAVDPDRAKKLDAIHAAIVGVREPAPEFVKQLVLGDKPTEEDVAAAKDLPSIIAAHMAWYIEWPHVDGMFARVFYTLPGHSRFWADDSDSN